MKFGARASRHWLAQDGNFQKERGCRLLGHTGEDRHDSLVKLTPYLDQRCAVRRYEYDIAQRQGKSDRVGD